MSQHASTYADDPTIGDAAPLWRRIPIDPNHLIFDENLGRIRPSSAAFDDHPNGTPMSVVLGEEVLTAGRQPESVLIGHDDYCLASFTAGLARSLKQGVRRSPLSEEPAHAEVFGGKTKKVRKTLAVGSTWIIAPPTENVRK